MSTQITDEQWVKIYGFLKSCSGIYTGQEEQCRLFIEAIHWIARSGVEFHFSPRYGYNPGHAQPFFANQTLSAPP